MKASATLMIAASLLVVAFSALSAAQKGPDEAPAPAPMFAPDPAPGPLAAAFSMMLPAGNSSGMRLATRFDSASSADASDECELFTSSTYSDCVDQTVCGCTGQTGVTGIARTISSTRGYDTFGCCSSGSDSTSVCLPTDPHQRCPSGFSTPGCCRDLQVTPVDCQNPRSGDASRFSCNTASAYPHPACCSTRTNNCAVLVDTPDSNSDTRSCGAASDGTSYNQAQCCRISS